MSQRSGPAVTRRKSLEICGLVGLWISAGCLGSSTGGGGDDSPEDVAKEMLKAIYDPDQEKALDLSHRDGPAAGTFSGRVMMPDPGTEAKNTTMEILEEDDTRVVIELNYEVDRLGEEPEPGTRTFELRTNDDDEWKVWSISADAG